MPGESPIIASVGALAAPTAKGKSPRVAIHTHGCKLNQSDSQTLAGQFRDAGYTVVDATAGADIVVLNSCTVTSTADAKARQFLRAAKRRSPNAVVVATGCYAQRAPGELQALEEVTLVVGNSAKSTLVDAAIRAAPVVEGTPAPAVSLQGAGKARPAGRTRAMVKIQEGCDQVCSYCIVPKVRGRERSILPDSIIEEINRYEAEGFREVVLTGTQLGSYGFDLTEFDIVRLLERILARTKVPRVRVSSLQAHEFSDDLLSLWSDSRLLPHFHIPLQCGSNPVLKRMRRRYDTTTFAAAVQAVRGQYPDAAVTSDIIVGFPGETDSQFRDSLRFADAMDFADIHVFPYSPRPGTSAYHLDDRVGDERKQERTSQMLALSADASDRFRRGQVGSIREVLWEQSSRAGLWTGLTDNYIRVRTASEANLANQITAARIASVECDLVNAVVGDYRT